MNAVKERFYRNRENLFESLTDHCQQTLEQACVDNGQASFMVSGGSTPAPLYQKLARRVMSWQKINVALVDDCWDEPNSENSAQGLVQKTLLQHNALDCPFTGLKSKHKSAEQGAGLANADYNSLPNPWDLTILGMGVDGHTASLFADLNDTNQASVQDSEDLVVAVTDDNVEHITLTKTGLMRSKQIVLLITGEEKLATFRQAQQETDHNKMPVSALLQQTQVPVQVFWAP